MKKLFAYILTITCILSLIGCTGNTDSDRHESPLSAYIGDDVTEVKITHIFMGQLTEWSIKGDDIQSLQIWANGLECEIGEFEEGDTPGNQNGGEIFSFELVGGIYSGFDYIINGPDTCYLLIEGTWYIVNNPSDPPIEVL